MKRSILALGLSLLFALSGCASVGGSEGPSAPVLARILESGKLRVGLSGGQPPFNVTARSGEPIGLDVDLARVLASSMNVELEFVTKPFAQLLPALEAGDVDMVLSGMTITAERNARVAFVGPYYVSGKSILTRSRTLAALDDTVGINDPAITLAALEGSTSQEFVEKVIPKATLVTVKSPEEGVAMVRDGKAQALVADAPTCVLALLRNPADGFATLTKPFTIEPIGIALPANDPLLANLVENYLNTIDGTGVLTLLHAKWFASGAWLAELP
jgi:polar amino acid transport system substrate-binding protein